MFIFRRSYALALWSLIIATVTVAPTRVAWPATFCVNTPDDLKAALFAATRNEEDDIIKLEQETYVGQFIHSGEPDYNLSILGGYEPESECAFRTVDASNTVLDGDAVGRALTLTYGSYYAGDFLVDGITFQNGAYTGLAIATQGSATVTNTNTINNVGGGIYASAQSNLTFINNFVDSNTNTGAAGGFTMGGMNLTITGNTFTNNHSDAHSGGGYIFGWTNVGTLSFESNVVVGNTAAVHSGGVDSA